jgi:tetratricopeptide (TPR) repeat protein
LLKWFVAAKPSCWLVPFNRNPRFVGRNTLLSELAERLGHTGRFKKAAVVGLGGIGKTQIALALAYRTKDKSPNTSVFWVASLSLDSVRKAYVDIGRQLNVPGLEEPTADVFGLVQQRLSHESAGQWLLIVDNADDLDMWFEPLTNDKSSSVRLVDYLPRSAHGSMLITTRSRKVAVRMAGNEVIEVPEMDEITAEQLLRRALITPALADFDETVRVLLKQLTFLPLAIIQAAAYINANSVSLNEFLSLLGDADDVVVELLSERFEDEGRYPEARNPIAMTWLISFEQIRRHDPLAADYLSFMACIEPKSIPQSLLPETKSRKKFLDAIGTLTAYSFVTKRAGGRSYDMHRLVHLVTRNWLAKERLLAHWNANVLARLARVFPDKNHLNRAIWRDLLPHARYKQIGEEKHSDDYLQLLGKYGDCLFSDGRYAEAETTFSLLMERRVAMLGMEHPHTLTSMAKLASTNRRQGRWADAETLEVPVLEARKKVLGQEHPDTLTSMDNLASTYRRQGRWTDAEALLVGVLEASKKVLGQEHPETLISMANLAYTWHDQGYIDKALLLMSECVELQKKKLGVDHPDTTLCISTVNRWRSS